jgi:hypothetical protein
LWPAASLVIVAILGNAIAASAAGAPQREITSTAKGRSLVASVAARHRALGIAATSSTLRAWEVGPGEFLVGPRMPLNFSTRVSTRPDGRRVVEMQFDVVATAEAPAARTAGSVQAAAADPTWSWRAQACFARLGGPALGYLDACYEIHRLKNESNPRDFYKLEQYGTVGAGTIRKIYDGWLAAAKGPGSGAMAWVDWSPRGDLSGSCQGVPLQVSALGIGIDASGIMCEHWDMTKSSVAGTYRQMWSCGCIFPFGQPFPNDREIDYMQAVSVPNGKPAIWTLTAGYSAL